MDTSAVTRRWLHSAQAPPAAAHAEAGRQQLVWGSGRGSLPGGGPTLYVARFYKNEDIPWLRLPDGEVQLSLLCEWVGTDSVIKLELFWPEIGDKLGQCSKEPLPHHAKRFGFCCKGVCRVDGTPAQAVEVIGGPLSVAVETWVEAMFDLQRMFAAEEADKARLKALAIGGEGSETTHAVTDPIPPDTTGRCPVKALVEEFFKGQGRGTGGRKRKRNK